MKIRYVIGFIVLYSIFIEIAYAQTNVWRKNRKEYLFGFGATNFLGELGGADQIGTNGLKDFDWPSVRPDFMIGYRYRLSRQSALKTNLYYVRLAGNDKWTKEPFRNNRNINFRSPVFELSTQFEYSVVRERPGHIYNLKGVRGWRYIQINTYFFAGIGVMYFNPRGKYEGDWYSLRPLSTEGQGLIETRKEYSPVQLVIPFGVGFKYAINKDLSVGIEYGIRKTFTDYIDDVSKTYFDPVYLGGEKGPMAPLLANPTNYSLPLELGNPLKATAPGQQRGDPTDLDSYMLAVISFYYKITSGRFTLPKFR